MARFSIVPRGIGFISLWSMLAISCLCVSSLLYIIALLTLGWGHVQVTYENGEKDQWVFGLWQCCRESDGLCIGPRWPTYYSITRAFGVMALFGHVLNAAWLIGHTLEKMFDYDPCALSSLITLSFTTCALVLVQVCVFGTMWGADMEETFTREFKEISTSLSYSYIIACVTCALLAAGGVFTIIELQQSFVRLTRKQRRGKRIIEDFTESTDRLYLSKKAPKKQPLTEGVISEDDDDMIIEDIN